MNKQDFPEVTPEEWMEWGEIIDEAEENGMTIAQYLDSQEEA